MQINYIKTYITRNIRKYRNKRLIHFVSFPKTGRTWVELMFAKALAELTGNTVSDILNNKVKTFRHKGNKKKLPFIQFGHGFLNSKICLGNFFPDKYYKKQDVIFLVRDPRDILVSLYYYDKFKYDNFEKDLPDFIKFDNTNAYNPKSERYGIKAVVNYLNTFIDKKESFKSFHVVYYEDLRKDVATVMKDLFCAADMPIDDELLQKIIEYGHIDNMRKLEQSNELNWYAMQSSGKASKVRKGKSGGYTDELSEKDIDFLNAYIKEHLHPFYNRYVV